MLRYGTTPVAVGQNAQGPGHYGYRNASGQTDFNFLTSDSRTFQEQNDAMALQIYATTTPAFAQSITNFVANPASPIVTDGNFSVSATGGTSGNAVVFSVASTSAAVCTAGGPQGATTTILNAGTCTVLANQAGNANHSNAPQQSRT